MVFIGAAQTSKGPGIMADEASAHFQDHGGLPGIIFAHSLGRAALQQGSPGRVRMMQALPPKTSQELADKIHILGPFEHLSHTHRAHP